MLFVFPFYSTVIAVVTNTFIIASIILSVIKTHYVIFDLQKVLLELSVNFVLKVLYH